MKLRIVLSSAAVLLATALLWAEVDLTGAKCPIGNAQAMAGMSVDYKGGKVYFCCDGCPQAFQADPAKYAAKANHQLFVTGQAKQIACPLTGERISSGVSAKIAGSTVEFCCPSCRDAVDNASDDAAKLDKVFGDEAFEKGFRVGD